MRFALTAKRIRARNCRSDQARSQSVEDRTSGFLFHNQKGKFLSQTNLLRRGPHPALKELGQPKASFHALRRFRTTWLRKNRTLDSSAVLGLKRVVLPSETRLLN